MQRTFLLTLNVVSDDPNSLAGLAEQIHESVTEDGLDVISVRPWSAPTNDALGTLESDPTDTLSLTPPAQERLDVYDSKFGSLF